MFETCIYWFYILEQKVVEEEVTSVDIIFDAHI